MQKFPFTTTVTRLLHSKLKSASLLTAYLLSSKNKTVNQKLKLDDYVTRLKSDDYITY